MIEPFTTGLTFCNAISALGSITFASITTVAARVGLTWNHFRDLLGSSISVTRQGLLRQWLYCDLTSDGQAPCWLIRAACILVSKLTNVSWSSDSMRYNPLYWHVFGYCSFVQLPFTKCIMNFVL